MPKDVGQNASLEMSFDHVKPRLLNKNTKNVGISGGDSNELFNKKADGLSSG